MFIIYVHSIPLVIFHLSHFHPMVESTEMLHESWPTVWQWDSRDVVSETETHAETYRDMERHKSN